MAPTKSKVKFPQAKHCESQVSLRVSCWVACFLDFSCHPVAISTSELSSVQQLIDYMESVQVWMCACFRTAMTRAALPFKGFNG